MPIRRLIRMLYQWASSRESLRRPIQAARSQPRVRALARRHVDVLLAQGTTWANVDGAVRLIAEDHGQRIVFGPWQGDAAAELLYWAPFVRWAQERFSLDPARVAVVSRGGVGHWYGVAGNTYADADDGRDGLRGAVLFRPEPVLALVEEYRRGAAPPRPLLKRSKHVLLEPPDGTRTAGLGAYVAVDLTPTRAFPGSDANRRLAEKLAGSVSAERDVVVVDRSRPLREQHDLIGGAAGFLGSYSPLAILGAFSGVPVVALRSRDGTALEPDLDLASRVTSALGGSLTVLDAADAEALWEAIRGR